MIIENPSSHHSDSDDAEPFHGFTNFEIDVAKDRKLSPIGRFWKLV